MRIRTHIGVSLDGFAATPEGYPALLSMPDFVPGVSHGHPEFIAECDAVVMGRTTFDPGHAYWAEQGGWPWPDLQVYVLTSRPLPEKVHPSVIASQGGPAGLLEQLRAARLKGDVCLLGGPNTIRAFHQLGAIDQLRLLLLPILLGDGLPLFPLGSSPQPLRLESQRRFPDGVMEMVYAPEERRA